MTSRKADKNTQDMTQWRAAIDRHDDEIMALIRSRLALSEEVGKTKAHGRLAWRPAREAQLFARLAGKAGKTLSPHAVERLWSTIIAQSLLAQGPAFLLVPRSHPALPALARSFFGLLPMHVVADPACALTRCAVEEGAIAILPAPGPDAQWWLQLASLNAAHEQAPAVLAALPRFAADGPPAAYAVARAACERSGDDWFWYVTQAGVANMPKATVLASAGDLRLVALESKTLPEAPQQARLVGVFAKPLHTG